MRTKTEFISAIQSHNTSLTRHEIINVLDSMSAVVIAALKTDGHAIVPGVVKLKAVKRPATPERPGVNPFTKQPVTIPAKPESLKVKASPAKSVKDAVGA